jgi:hypothetical protein
MTTRHVAASAPGQDGELAELAARWHAEAVNLRGWGACGQAEAVARCAAQLEAVLAETDGDAALAGDR